MVQGTLNSTGFNKVLQGSGHVVGGLYFGLIDKQQVNLPRKLDTEPDLTHTVADRTAHSEGHRVDLVTAGRKHNLKHQHPQEEILPGLLPLGLRGCIGPASTFVSVQPLQQIHG